MPGNSFGTLLRITTFGESHGTALGAVVDGLPAGIRIELAQIQAALDRRRPGQSAITTPRKEADKVEVLSGIFEEKTTGAPVAMLIRNHNARPKDYDALKEVFRPSHADFTYHAKYGHRDHRGGGRASARETVARVAAGALVRQWLAPKGIRIHGFVSRVGPVILEKEYSQLDFSLTEKNIVRCPDETTAQKMIAYIEKVKKEGDTVGGVVSCVISGVPAGLGEPVFDKLHADLGKAVLSINACKGFEYGSGFAAAAMLGSQHNDEFLPHTSPPRTKTNHSGGIQGGISNGMDIYFNAAFKPVATLMRDQPAVDIESRPATIKGKGRHDACVVPRAVPIVEAMAWLVLGDHWLRARAYS